MNIWPRHHSRHSMIQAALVLLTAIRTDACSSLSTPERTAQGAGERLSLAGPWRFALDESNRGRHEQWYRAAATALTDTITLPGTTDEGCKGQRNDKTKETGHLSRLYPYAGAAWYQRDIMIPEHWKDRHITLELERTKVTEAWVDDTYLGKRDSLATPQAYDLGTTLSSGRHRLTILVDNKNLPASATGIGHQLSEHTQTNWNGIVGRMELRATDKVWIEDIQLYPNVHSRRVKARITLGNLAGRSASGTITLTAAIANPSSPYSAVPLTVAFKNKGDAIIEADYPLGADAPLWDEFTPTIYRMEAMLEAKVAFNRYADRRECSFALRAFATRGTQFTINGKTTFLRGKVDCCVFPLTGYAPMHEANWDRVFRIAKSYGINHYRFHTWCPPEAAFAAADRLGIYLQPELMYFAGSIEKPGLADYALAEGKRILAAYGNHPSFVMFALGNEIRNSLATRARLIVDLRRFDGRHLYTQASNYRDKKGGQQLQVPGDDYWTTMYTASGGKGIVRGSYGTDEPLGHVQTGPPATTHDYTAAIRDVPMPVIAHEVGQYQVYPNFKEIPKYTGVLRPWNFEIFRKRLTAAGMLDQADDFVQASGKLAVACYREEIEAALRTPGMGGFQLLDLQDFPGQGTALVGILDAFMDSKGLVTPEAWRQFCAPIVPLVLTEKYCWTTDERFTARVKVANYGPAALPGAAVAWSIREADGKELAHGTLPGQDIPQGGLSEPGRIEASLAGAGAPGKLKLILCLEGTQIQNVYEVWVYPNAQESERRARQDRPASVTVTRRLDEALRALAGGRRVLLLPEPTRLAKNVEGFFTPDFWNYPMFRAFARMFKNPEAPGTLGLLMDPHHPALADFPTESHSNWQWFNIVMRSRTMILNGTPLPYKPIVQVIDNFARNQKLGLIFEARVGSGRVLVCGADLPALREHPEARQLLASLVSYAGSARFDPGTSLTSEQLRQIVVAK